MMIGDWLMIAAVLLAPIVAVQVSQLLERRREGRQRRLAVFRTLMTTRRSRLAPDHIQALNMIDVEFSGTDKKSRAVVDAWKAYLDHLNDSSMSMEVWTARGDDLFVDLVYNVATAVGYDFDKTHLRRASYYPRGYGEAEWDQQIIRRGFREVLEGKRWIPIGLAPTESQPQQELSSPQELSRSDGDDQKELPPRMESLLKPPRASETASDGEVSSSGD